MRRILKILAAVAAIYLAALAGLYAIMTLPPERFARIIAALPSPVFMVLPFPPMWKIARGGHLSVGMPAPDFDLATLDKSARVRLSSFQGNKPVVLIFGSYT
jgi:hypothetical protein